MTLGGGDGITKKFGPICIIIPKVNEISDKVRIKLDPKNFNENVNI